MKSIALITGTNGSKNIFYQEDSLWKPCYVHDANAI